jgi:hypothetical protein
MSELELRRRLTPVDPAWCRTRWSALKALGFSCGVARAAMSGGGEPFQKEQPPERSDPLLRPRLRLDDKHRRGAALRAATPTQTCITRCGLTVMGRPTR